MRFSKTISDTTGCYRIVGSMIVHLADSNSCPALKRHRVIVSCLLGLLPFYPADYKSAAI